MAGAGVGQLDAPPCGFSKNVSSREMVDFLCQY